jgi:serine/threonine-protein kinase
MTGRTRKIVPRERARPSPPAVTPVSTVSAGAAPIAPQRIGRYRVGFELASGGMAVVYLARLEMARGLDKVVALKCIHAHLARDPRFVEMFLDEARIASRVSHANVCQVFDLGETDGRPYLAMEYLAGEPLGRVLEAAAPQKDTLAYPALVARILADACEGLHAAHELTDEHGKPLGVVHRDVSPQNLFVTFDGITKVVDFGIAWAADRVHRTTTGEVKGSLAYAAPEQIRAGDSVDRRADVWALGVLLWQALAGRPLFRRATPVETMYAVLSDPIPPLEEVQPGVPADLAAVVARALCRERSGRFATARELATALQDAVRRAGEWPSQADVRELMEQLFPDGRAGHDAHLRRAREATEGGSVVRPALARPRRRRAAIALGAVLLAGVAAAVAVATGAGLPIGGDAFVATQGSAPAESGPAPRVDPEPAGARTRPGAPLPAAIDPPAADPSATVAPTPADPPATVAPTPADPSATVAPTPADPPPASGDRAPPDPARVPSNGRENAFEPGRDRARAPSAAGSAASEPGRDRARRPAKAPSGSAPAATGERRAEPGAVGQVNVVTPDGWGIVYLGDRRLGQTPLRTALPAGSHLLSVHPFGRPPARQVRVTADPARPARVVVRFDR